MVKTKFRYNPETLSYEKVDRSTGERILRTIIFMAPTLVLSIVFGFFIAYRIDSPKEKRLKSELSEMRLIVEGYQSRLEVVDKVTEAIKQRDESLYRTALGA
jgi:hypothetical protein